MNPDRAVQFIIAEGLLARGDANLLRIVLENLIGNSFKFSGSRSPAVIEIGQGCSHGANAFYIRDNGAGFDMTYADKIFGAFQRLHSQKDFPGTGIGLATVQRVINRHNGRVWTESAPDKGATFYFTLFQEGRHEDNHHTARRG